MQHPTAAHASAQLAEAHRSIAALEQTVLNQATEDQRRAFQQLRDSGWHIRAWHHDTHALHIDGLDNWGDAFRGGIAPTGYTEGEPCTPGNEPDWLRLEGDLTHASQRDLVTASLTPPPHDVYPRRHRVTPAERVLADLRALELA